jgi:hypothetical protein
VDAAGCASKPLTTALSDPKNIGRHLDEIETLLAGGNGFNVVGSTVVLPGSPGPDNRTIGKAPWLHGAVTLELERPMLTNAEALLRAESTREPDLLDHFALAIDLNDGASAVVRTPEGASVLLNLMGTPGPEHVYMRRSFAKFVKENAARPDSSIAIHVRQGAPEVEALRLSESEGDVVACTLVDETSDSVAKYIGWLARMIRPMHLVVGSWLFAAGILDPNDISRRVRRLCPPGVVQRLAFRCIEGDEGSHLAGGGLCAIERWLQQMESDA